MRKLTTWLLQTDIPEASERVQNTQKAQTWMWPVDWARSWEKRSRSMGGAKVKAQRRQKRAHNWNCRVTGRKWGAGEGSSWAGGSLWHRGGKKRWEMPGCHHGLKMFNSHKWYANRHHRRHLSLLSAVREMGSLVEGNGLHKFLMECYPLSNCQNLGKWSFLWTWKARSRVWDQPEQYRPWLKKINKWRLEDRIYVMKY